MNQAPLYIVDIIGEVVRAADAVLFPTLNKHILYTYGRSIQILTKLQTLNQGITQATKNSKYPLFALFQPFVETTGTNGYYCAVKFPKISIATLTQSTSDVPTRYNETFRPILYPIWAEFQRQLVRHPNIVGNDPGAIMEGKMDNPGEKPKSDPEKAANFNDYLDSIDIIGLQLTFKTVNKCKTFKIT